MGPVMLTHFYSEIYQEYSVLTNKNKFKYVIHANIGI